MSADTPPKMRRSTFITSERRKIAVFYENLAESIGSLYEVIAKGLFRWVCFLIGTTMNSVPFG